MPVPTGLAHTSHGQRHLHLYHSSNGSTATTKIAQSFLKNKGALHEIATNVTLQYNGGDAQQRKAYRLVHQLGRFIESRDVIFDEAVMYAFLPFKFSLRSPVAD